MEEASFDHGTDRLRFFLVSLLAGFFLSTLAHATTFGPILVSKQIENATHVVHGRIVGSSWVAEERQSRRPYTHWKLQVIEQPKGEKIGDEVVIRQPGGELGGLGYRVAGTATFRGGEEVFVNLRNTEDPGVKEVVALASGKYTVEKDAAGNPVLMSGLGFILRDEKGAPYSPASFIALTKRIVEGEATEADRNVFVSNKISHDTETDLTPEARAAVKSAVQNITPKSSSPSPLEIQKTESAPEEPKGSRAGWWIFLVGLLLVAFLGGRWLKKN